MGQLEQTRKKQRPTKPTQPKKYIEEDKEYAEITPETHQITNTEATHLIFVAVEKTGKIYTYRTGLFPITSRKGNKYICLIYGYATSTILTDPLNNQREYSKIRVYPTARGLKPSTRWIYNESCEALKQYDIENKAD